MQLFLTADKSEKIPITKRKIESSLLSLFEELGNKDSTNCELAISFISEESMKKLNFRFRNENKITNVLAFPEFEPLALENFLGNIAICLSVINEEANKGCIKISDHLTHIIIHGTLHLLGYDHQNRESADIMESIEISVLKNLKIDNPYENSIL